MVRRSTVKVCVNGGSVWHNGMVSRAAMQPVQQSGLDCSLLLFVHCSSAYAPLFDGRMSGDVLWASVSTILPWYLDTWRWRVVFWATAPAPAILCSLDGEL
ncbi:unnamed protein product [Prorocentrum cordatum]|uniref:Uncharacterized protein n=1 Tax=Prorocentrum cordatum TaxID=2364126 RepID=A0ABN9X9J2_9DINO|nr:unnamed protein product [Polarella glacialis]